MIQSGHSKLFQSCTVLPLAYNHKITYYKIPALMHSDSYTKRIYIFLLQVKAWRLLNSDFSIHREELGMWNLNVCMTVQIPVRHMLSTEYIRFYGNWFHFQLESVCLPNIASFPGSPRARTKNRKKGESLVKFIT